MKQGYVYYCDRLCGTIIQTDENRFIFEYLDSWLADDNAKPVSLTLPTSNRRYESTVLFPFFDGLIPEGYLLEVAMRMYNIERNDRMSLLLKVCHDPIGAVSVWEEKKDA